VYAIQSTIEVAIKLSDGLQSQPAGVERIVKGILPTMRALGRNAQLRSRLMHFTKYSFALAFVLLPSVGNAQDAAEIERIADMMVRLCVGGGHSELVEGGGTAGANLSVRTFDLVGNITGQFRVTKSSAANRKPV
jgi:hypothetical protein